MKKRFKVVPKIKAQKSFLPFKSPYDQPLCYDRTPYSCVWCDFKFDSIQRVETHVLSSHQYNCNHCLKELKTWKDFLIHCEDCEHAKRDKTYFKKAA